MKKRVFLTQAFLIIFILFFFVKKTEAAFLKLEPATVSTNSNEQFTISVNIDTEGEEVNSVDVYINYDANLLEAQQVSEGSFFPTVTNNIASGQIYIGALVDDPATSKQGTGTIATVTFKVLNDGSVTLSVDCSSSKIVKADMDATNILDCSKNGSSQVTIGSGSQTESSSTTSSSSTSSSSSSSSTSSTPSSLPRSGVFEDLVNIGLPGIVLVSLGVIGKILLKY